MNAVRIGSASAFGAIVGGLTALSLLPDWLWFLGALFGGAVGYFSYNWKEVLAGVLYACKTTIAWQPNKSFWKVFGMSMLWMQLFGLHVAVIVCAIFGADSLQIPGDRFATQMVVAAFLSLLWFGLTTSIAVSALRPGTTWAHNHQEEHLAMQYADAKVMCLRFNPLSSKYWVYTAIRNLPTASRFVGQFVYQVIVFIHSDARTMCFLGGSIGATAGYFSGSWLIGAVAGGVAGLVSHELVGKRLLHIVAR